MKAYWHSFGLLPYDSRLALLKPLHATALVDFEVVHMKHGWHSDTAALKAFQTLGRVTEKDQREHPLK